MLPNKRAIYGPENGWEERCYYIVEIAFSEYNPIHKAIFYTGFLHEGRPCGYNTIFNPTYGDNASIEDAYYLRAIQKIEGIGP